MRKLTLRYFDMEQYTPLELRLMERNERLKTKLRDCVESIEWCQKHLTPSEEWMWCDFFNLLTNAVENAKQELE